MDFQNIATARFSCRRYDPDRPVDGETLAAILSVARLSPSACNGQPYRITVCTEQAAGAVGRACGGMGMNRFAAEAPVLLVISEQPYVKSAAIGARLKNNDYRSMDIGILAAYLTAAATEYGLGSCMLGWFDGDAIARLCGLDGAVRLVITLGYPVGGESAGEKKRKPLSELVQHLSSPLLP